MAFFSGASYMFNVRVDWGGVTFPLTFQSQESGWMLSHAWRQLTPETEII